jgi:hypothetical protein
MISHAILGYILFLDKPQLTESIILRVDCQNHPRKAVAQRPKDEVRWQSTQHSSDAEGSYHCGWHTIVIHSPWANPKLSRGFWLLEGSLTCNEASHFHGGECFENQPHLWQRAVVSVRCWVQRGAFGMVGHGQEAPVTRGPWMWHETVSKRRIDNMVHF